MRRPVHWVLRVAILLCALALTASGPATAVVVRAEGGAVVAAVPLPPDGHFALAYRHSVHQAPTLERFAAEPDGEFRLIGVSSPSEAVLDYYAIEGARRRSLDGWHLELYEPQSFAELPLIATSVGERALVVAGNRTKLAAPDRPAHLTLDVER